MFINDDQKCKSKNDKCKYYCNHNEGCALLITKGDSLIALINNIGDPGCDIYRTVYESRYKNDDIKKPRICKSCSNEYENGCLPPVSGDNCNAYIEKPVSKAVCEFDYSAVDQETANFLQKKVQRITEIRVKSVIAIGKELSETFDKLSKVGYGDKTKTFDKWVESIGISPRHARRYINAYEYVVENFGNIEEAEKIQPSLLFAISRPSAPKELQEKVLSGDITTHKQYKELEAKLKQAEQEKLAAEQRAKNIEALKQKLEEQNRILLDKKQAAEQALKHSKTAHQSKNDLYRNEIEHLQNKIATLTKELKEAYDKPIETTAIEIVEKVPDDVRRSVKEKVMALIGNLSNLSEAEIQIFIEETENLSLKILSATIEKAIKNLQKIDSRGLDSKKVEPHMGYCCECIHSDMDAVTEEQVDNNITYCSKRKKIVTFFEYCGSFEPIARR